jgi:YD repeat-containing protein
VETVTDPKGIVNKTYFDNLGRTIKTIENYTNGTPTNSSDKTTEYTFDGDGHTLTLKADLAGGGNETTQWTYGASVGAGDAITSNDMLKSERDPDPTTGNPSTSQQKTQTVNALGEVVTATDRNGTVHTYSYDVLGRTVSDAVTTLGTGVDGAVRRIETAYDTQGNAYLVTSYDAATAGNVVNQIQRTFNGLGQLTQEYQSVSGSVNTTTTPNVQYAYAEMTAGNNSRLTSITYPSGKVLKFNYNSGVDGDISRLSSISDSTGVLEAYAYLGLATVIDRTHPEIGIDLS